MRSEIKPTEKHFEKAINRAAERQMIQMVYSYDYEDTRKIGVDDLTRSMDDEFTAFNGEIIYLVHEDGEIES